MITQPITHLPAPDFTLPDLQGNIHALRDYRGQIVILNFWSAECPWSERTDRELLPALDGWNAALAHENAHGRERRPHVALLPIAPNANESRGLLASAAAARDLDLVLHDSNRLVTETYGAQITPHLFVVDPTGILRYQGAFDDVTFRQRTPTRHYLKDAVDALLRGDSPDPCETPAYGCTIVHFAG